MFRACPRIRCERATPSEFLALMKFRLACGGLLQACAWHTKAISAWSVNVFAGPELGAAGEGVGQDGLGHLSRDVAPRQHDSDEGERGAHGLNHMQEPCLWAEGVAAAPGKVGEAKGGQGGRIEGGALMRPTSHALPLLYHPA